MLQIYIKKIIFLSFLQQIANFKAITGIKFNNIIKFRINI